MKDRKTGTRFPSPTYPIATPAYSVDRWGIVHRINKAENAVARRLAAVPKFSEVRA